MLRDSDVEEVDGSVPLYLSSTNHVSDPGHQHFHTTQGIDTVQIGIVACGIPSRIFILVPRNFQFPGTCLRTKLSLTLY
jgi:hypothetical protein